MKYWQTSCNQVSINFASAYVLIPKIFLARSPLLSYNVGDRLGGLMDKATVSGAVDAGSIPVRGTNSVANVAAEFFMSLNNCLHG